MSFGVLLVVSIVLTSCVPAIAGPVATETPGLKLRNAVTVTIVNPNIQGAIARVLGTKQVANLKEDTLSLKSCSDSQYISVWAPGYYVKTFACDRSFKNTYSVTLTRLPTVDNPNYAWINAGVDANPTRNCVTCHGNLSTGLNEYDEWSGDGHSRVFVDSYFWSMYTGINQNPAAPLGPGFRVDFRSENGNCAFCHAPAALQALQQGIDLTTWNVQLPGIRANVETEGITCDVCHKVVGVLLGEDGLPMADRPGVLSFDLLRPPTNELFFIGPWPDHKPDTPQDTPGFNHNTACSTVFGESKFCAVCHYGKFFDTVVYNSYGEWLDSRYSKKKSQNYRSCQDCHMQSSQPVDGTSWQDRSACYPENHSFRDFSHNMMKRDNAGNPILIQGAAKVTVKARQEQGKIKVTVTVVNNRAGHKFPTDSPLRHLILVVEAKDKDGNLLAPLEGDRIPEWGGSAGQPEDYAGQPGVIYGNILKDRVTGDVPAVAYWNPTIPAWDDSDTRLVPFEEAVSEYSFVAPSRGKVTVAAKLLYRYAFLDLIRQKGWPLQDILVNWDEDIVE
jgi:hypothetical protein